MIVGILRRAAFTSLSMPSLEIRYIWLMVARGNRAAKGLLALVIIAIFIGCLSTEVAVMRKSYMLSLPTVCSMGLVCVRQRWTTRATRGVSLSVLTRMLRASLMLPGSCLECRERHKPCRGEFDGKYRNHGTVRKRCDRFDN